MLRQTPGGRHGSGQARYTESETAAWGSHPPAAPHSRQASLTSAQEPLMGGADEGRTAANCPLFLSSFLPGIYAVIASPSVALCSETLHHGRMDRA